MATDYSNLGVMYQTRGDLDLAEQMCRNSLEINEQLGAKEGMANNYSNLGVIYQTRGDLDRGEIARARDLWTKARDLFAEIGIAPQIEQIQKILDSLQQTGPSDKAR